MSVHKNCSPGDRVYSEKIRERRRALFTNSELTDMDVDANPLSLLPESAEYQNISEIPSTELIRKILGTPQRQTDFTLIDTSPSKGSEDNGHISSLSLTEILETPEDSNTQTEKAPKLSRKSTSESSEKEDLSLSSNEASKVRTTLFPVEVSLSTKQFYPSTESQIKKKSTAVTLSQIRKLDKVKTRKYQSRKKLFGQINAGVKHKIKKKIDKSPKVFKACLTQTKTYKSDLAVTSKFDQYFKDLEEIKESKKVKLIEHLPGRNQSIKETGENSTISPETIETAVEKNFESTEPTVEIHLSRNTFGDDSVEDDELSVPIDNIIDALEESIGEDGENVSRDKVGILSPTSELSNMTLGLKLGSPRKVKNLTAVFQNMADENTQEPTISKQQRYYPLFYPQKRCINKGLEKDCPIKKKRMKVSYDQMLLDAGQRKFGLVECGECNFVYNAGDPNDEALHENHHNAMNILQYNGWKNERIVEQFDGKVIQVLPGDSKQWIDKVKRIVEYINREMGYHDVEIDITKSMVFLYVFHKSIIGCLVAESKTAANKILTANVDVDLCSLEEYPVQCGVSRLWIAPNYRKKGIATKLMETLRKHFLMDRMLKKYEIALSAPTPEGKIFGTKYFETPNFYTYMN